MKNHLTRLKKGAAAALALALVLVLAACGGGAPSTPSTPSGTPGSVAPSQPAPSTPSRPNPMEEAIEIGRGKVAALYAAATADIDIEAESITFDREENVQGYDCFVFTVTNSAGVEDGIYAVGIDDDVSFMHDWLSEDWVAVYISDKDGRLVIDVPNPVTDVPEDWLFHANDAHGISLYYPPEATLYDELDDRGYIAVQGDGYHLFIQAVYSEYDAADGFAMLQSEMDRLPSEMAFWAMMTAGIDGFSLVGEPTPTWFIGLDTFYFQAFEGDWGGAPIDTGWCIYGNGDNFSAQVTAFTYGGYPDPGILDGIAEYMYIWAPAVAG